MENETAGGDYIVNKNITDYPETTREVYNLLQALYGYSARMSIMWQLLATALNIKEFEILDYYYVQNGPFMSWLLDQQIDWIKGNDVNLTEVYRGILEAGDFTTQEEILFNTSNIEERLWAIFLLITDPGLNL